MRTLLGISLVVLFLASSTALLAQSKSEAATKNETEQVGTVEKANKVSEGRKVVIRANRGQTTKTAEAEVKYDAKGGIVVPNASKGIGRKSLKESQKAKLDKMRESQLKSDAPKLKKNAPAQRYERDLSQKKIVREKKVGGEKKKRKD